MNFSKTIFKTTGKTSLLMFALFLCRFGYTQVVEDFSGVSMISGLKDSTRHQALYNNPHGMDISPDGTIYIADRYNHVIRRIDTLGIVTLVAGSGVAGDLDGTAFSAQFNEPWGVVSGNNGEVYVADAKNNKIRIIDTNGIVSTFAGTGNVGFTDSFNPLAASFYWPSDLEYDHDNGDLYVAGHLSHLIRKVDASGVVSTIAGTKNGYPNNFGAADGSALSASFYRPYGIHLTSNKDLIIADEWNSMIRVLTKDSVYTIGGQQQQDGYNDGGVNSSRFNYPWDVTTDSRGTVYVIDGFNYTIRTINPETKVTRYFSGDIGAAGAANGSLADASFNATSINYYEPEGSLYISDAYNHVIRRILLVEEPLLTLSSSSVCMGDTLGLSVSPTYYDSYEWYDESGLLGVTSGPSFESIIAADTIAFWVKGIRNGIGESSSDTLIISAPVVSAADIVPSGVDGVCNPDSLSLSSSSGPGLWNTNDFTDVLFIDSSGTYSIRIYDSNCLVSFGEITVSLDVIPEISLSPEEQYINPSDSVLLVASGAENYLWSNGEVSDSIYVSGAGLYTVVGQSLNGCFSLPDSASIFINTVLVGIDDTIFIELNENVTTNLFLNDLLSVEVSSILSLTTITGMTQFYSEGELTLHNFDVLSDTVLTGSYQVCTITVPQVCDSALITVVITGFRSDYAYDLFIPDGFSPNGDGVNDFFEIIGISNIPENILEIYNRWGALVYSSEDYQNDWDGIYNGNELPEGVYFYVFKDILLDEKIHGNVLVKR